MDESLGTFNCTDFGTIVFPVDDDKSAAGSKRLRCINMLRIGRNDPPLTFEQNQPYPGISRPVFGRICVWFSLTNFLMCLFQWKVLDKRHPGQLFVFQASARPQGLRSYRSILFVFDWHILCVRRNRGLGNWREIRCILCFRGAVHRENEQTRKRKHKYSGKKSC